MLFGGTIIVGGRTYGTGLAALSDEERALARVHDGLRMHVPIAAPKKVPNPITQYPLGFPPMKQVEKLFGNEGKPLGHLLPPTQTGVPRNLPPLNPADTDFSGSRPGVGPLPTTGVQDQAQTIGDAIIREVTGLLRGELDTVTPGKAVRTLEERLGERIIGGFVKSPIDIANWIFKGTPTDPSGRSDPPRIHVGAVDAGERLRAVWSLYQEGRITQRERDEQLAAIRSQVSRQVYTVWVEFMRRFQGLDGLPPSGSGPPGSGDP